MTARTMMITWLYQCRKEDKLSMTPVVTEKLVQSNICNASTVSVAKLAKGLGSGSPTSIRSAGFADLHKVGSILPSHSPYTGFQTVTTWNAQWPWRYLCLLLEFS
ncbi:hypothetical protein ILYODFUR_030404 [Ilyodon furcidens]|uniref:Uncharacterized protein n=1 Tax=Ilyodon furcidens TaxID=33524 RepID=A0ABV0UCF1_9TELE